MIISHKYKFVIFAPWKTASTTLHVRFKYLNDSPYDTFYYYNSILNRVVHQHITCADFSILPESKLEYFSASFVRNPYDRAYSGFHQIQKDYLTQPTYEFSEPWIRELVVAQLSENYAQMSKAGFDFDEWIKLLREEQVYEIGRNSSFPLHPSYFWTHINGQQYVDFVGKTEDFENDLSSIYDKIGLCSLCEINANENITLRESRRSNSLYKYAHLMNVASIEKINTLFHDDFNYYNYQKLTS